MPSRTKIGKRKKVRKVMGEHKKGTLRSGGSKKKVKGREQAIAIAVNEGSQPKGYGR